MMKEIKFTDIPGLKLGHAQSEEGITGCSVVICEDGATAGVDVRGGAPGTRETDLLDPVNLVDKVHAVFLAGGSAFGLDAASGIMKYLEERNKGFDVGVTKVPIVTGAVLFDLTVGDFRIRPDSKMGYAACENASNASCPEGNVGAGYGATVGKINGPQNAMKGGLGTYCLQVGDLMVGAVVAVNCLGDVVDPTSGRIIAGALNKNKDGFVNTEEVLISQYDKAKNVFSGNTTIGIIATNAKLTKSQAKKIASMAHNGYARTMRPAHSMFDGDTIFALGTGYIDVDTNVIGFLAARVMEQAILRGIKNAESIQGYKCFHDINCY